MSNLLIHAQEIGKTLAPAYGPESPSDAVDRLIEYYYRLSEADKYAFVAALIGELVTLKAAAKHRRIDLTSSGETQCLPQRPAWEDSAQ